MLMYAVIILVVVLGSVFAIALISNLIAGVPRAWKTLRERYPEQVSAEFVERRTANIFLSATDDPQGVLKPRGCLFVGFDQFAGNRNAQNVRLSLDDYYLHLDLDSGAGGPKAPMAIPWGTLTIGQEIATHVGSYHVLSVDEFTLLVPTASIERELLMRAALDDSEGDNPFDDQDPFDTLGGGGNA